MTIEDRTYKEPLILPNYPHGTVVNHKRVKRIYSELTVRQLLYNLIRREGSMAKAAKVIGVSRAFLSQVMSGKAQPGAKISDYFGFERHVIYVRIRPGSPLNGTEMLKRDAKGGVVMDFPGAPIIVDEPEDPPYPLEPVEEEFPEFKESKDDEADSKEG